jgi:hypothetical protein
LLVVKIDDLKRRGQQDLGICRAKPSDRRHMPGVGFIGVNRALARQNMEGGKLETAK